jgi:hypothetical protein
MGMIGVPICAALKIGNGGGMDGMTPFQKGNMSDSAKTRERNQRIAL